jgi:Holliday junction DNA helicase RuvA
VIAQLTGKVARTEANSVVLEVGGVGYLVYVPVTVLSNLPAAGGKLTLMTHLVGRVQPDFEVALYGFTDAEQLRTFKILLGVSGVGAKVGLALLSTLSVAEIAHALATNDIKLVTRVPGIGPKLAQRLCLELGDKMAAFAFEQRAERAAAGQRTAQENASYEEAIDALVGLGFGRQDSRRAVDHVFAHAADKTDTAALVSAALQFLTGGKR